MQFLHAHVPHRPSPSGAMCVVPLAGIESAATSSLSESEFASTNSGISVSQSLDASLAGIDSMPHVAKSYFDSLLFLLASCSTVGALHASAVSTAAAKSALLFERARLLFRSAMRASRSRSSCRMILPRTDPPPISTPSIPRTFITHISPGFSSGLTRRTDGAPGKAPRLP